jgi:hypothetical protein
MIIFLNMSTTFDQLLPGNIFIWLDSEQKWETYRVVDERHCNARRKRDGMPHSFGPKDLVELRNSFSSV